MLIKLDVGIASSVLMSTWKTLKDNLSILCKNGNLKPAPPMMILRLPKPEIINAVDYVCWTRRQEHKPHKPSCIIKLSAESEVTIIRK